MNLKFRALGIGYSVLEGLFGQYFGEQKDISVKEMILFMKQDPFRL